MARRMTITEATRIVADLATQDHGLPADERTDARGRDAIDGWRRGAREAGDQACLDAIDRLGTGRAADVYDARRAALVARRAR